MAGEEDILKRLAGQAAGLDDEAWVALGSKGLLRRARKDQAAGEVGEPVVDAAGNVCIPVSGWSVVFGPSGVAAGICGCPASGVCQHLLAAVLSLAARAEGLSDREEPEREIDGWLGMEESVLRKWCGAEDFRKALDLALRQTGEVVGARIRFRTGVECHLVEGAGLEGVITSATPRHERMYKVAAVLAYRESAGVKVAAGSGGLEPVVAGDPDLPARVAGWLEEAVDLGLQHLTGHSMAVARVLSMSCRTAGLHRVSLELEAIAQGIGWQLDRHARADSERLFAGMARLHALAEALRRSGSRAPADLIGQARGRFDEGVSLELLGVGVYPWETESGYRGITVLFRGDDRYLSWSDVRPKEVDGTFRPELRYAGPGPWRGAGKLKDVAASRLTLSRPRLSEDGRLGAGENTVVVSCQPGQAAPDRVPVCREWGELERMGAARAGLRRSRPLDRVVLVEPKSWGTAVFDEVEQRLRLPVTDRTGAVLNVELPYTSLGAGAIAFLEEFRAGNGCFRLLALVAVGTPATLFPVTLYSERDRWDLWFQPLPKHSRFAGWGKGMQAKLASFFGGGRQEEAAVGSSELAAFLAPGLAALRARAEGGMHSGGDRTDPLVDVSMYDRAGLGELARSLEAAGEPSGLLRAEYLHRVTMDLAGAGDQVEPR